MAPFEALYGRRCRTPACWDEVGVRRFLGPELISQANERVQAVRQHLRAAQDRYKAWSDKRRRPLEFQIGDLVFLKVSPTRGVFRFGMKGKLSPRYVGPFPILDRVGSLAYRLELPPHLTGVHPVFHISQLRGYIRDPSHVVDYSQLAFNPDLSYTVDPVRIVDRTTKDLRGRSISLVKVSWDPAVPEECTWEKEEDIRSRYPHLFLD